MKIRNGFVSNSSSSSFVVISKEPLSVIKPADESTPDGGYIHITTAGVSYLENNISVCRTLEDKLRYFTALYAIYYEEDKDYFIKMNGFQSKIEALGEKYGYKITVICPPLSGCVRDLAWDSRGDPEVITYVDIPCQCTQLYEQGVVDIIENEDTTELESYLFNPHSFCLLGGSEHPKTLRLAHRMRKFADKEGYEYRKFGDIVEDHEVGDPIPGTDSLRYTDAYHWGEYTFKDRIREWRISLYLLWRKIKDRKRIAMLRKVDIYEN